MHTSRLRPARPRGRLAPALAALMALAGCDRDPAELAREIDDARAGCTEERLRAADEECVRMFERYAEMGTEGMRSYIGAVKSLDRALQRLPAARLDTAGLGHALTPAPRETGAPDAFPGRLAPARAPDSYREYAPAGAPYAGASDAYDRYGESDRRRAYGPGGSYDPAYDDERYGAPYGDGRDGYGYRYDGYGEYPDPGHRYGDEYGRGEYGRDGYGRYGYGRPEYGRDGYPPRGYGYDPRPGADRRVSPHERGRFPRDPRERGLLPPAERLRRPWLEEDGAGVYRVPATERYHAPVQPDPSGRAETTRPRRRPGGER